MTTEEITKLNNLISLVAMCITDTEHTSWEINDYLQYTLPHDLPREVCEHIMTIVLSGHHEINQLMQAVHGTLEIEGE